MTDALPSTADDGTLESVLRRHAHAVSARRLALDVAGGGLVAALLLVWRPIAWPTGLGIALCFVAFGVWGTAERRLAVADALGDAGPATASERRAWRALRAAAGAVGVVAAALAGFSLLSGAFGNIVH